MDVASLQKLVSRGRGLEIAAVDPGLNTAGFCVATFTEYIPNYVAVGSVSSIITGSEHATNSVGLAIEKARQVSIDLSRRILASRAKIVVIETPPQHFAGNPQTKMKKSQDARLLFGMVTMLYGALLARDNNFKIVTVEPSQWQPGFARGDTKGWSTKFASKLCEGCDQKIVDDHSADAVSMLYIVSGAHDFINSVMSDVAPGATI